jgi:hypothetical protein
MPWHTVPVQYAMKDRGHGHDEVRTIQVLPAPAGIFPHAARNALLHSLPILVLTHLEHQLHQM